MSENMELNWAERLRFLSTIDPNDMRDRIAQFRNNDFSQMKERDISERFFQTLLWNGRFIMLTQSCKYSKGVSLYRVRKIGELDDIKPFHAVSELWEPPKQFLKNYGRLNKPHEPVLYTSLLPRTACLETHIDPNDYFGIVKYIAKRDILCNVIGGSYNYPSLGVTEQRVIANHELLVSFLREEFSREVTPGNEFQYKVSWTISRDYFDLPAEWQDAWMYPSVQDRGQYNLCFRPEVAHEVLEAVGVIFCKLGQNSGLPMIYTLATGTSDGKLEYIDIGSEKQKLLFPEIGLPSK